MGPSPPQPARAGPAQRAAQGFWAQPKTLPQGQFTCPEDVKSKGVPSGSGQLPWGSTASGDPAGASSSNMVKSSKGERWCGGKEAGVDRGITLMWGATTRRAKPHAKMGSPREPSAAGRVGRGRARERSEKCPTGRFERCGLCEDDKTRFASLLEKERFLESKEKGAPVRVEWSQIGIRRPGFTPPLRSSPVYGRLPGWNRDKPWSYPTFFRRLRG